MKTIRTNKRGALIAGCIAGLALAIGTSGCASTVMKNTSPAGGIVPARDAPPIAATVAVKATGSDDRASGMLRQALADRGLFSRVAGGEEDADYEIAVSSSTDDDDHFGYELFKSFVVGLTLYTTAGLFADEHDHRVTLRATVFRHKQQLMELSSTGSYHSEVPRLTNINNKLAAVSKVRQKSWEHAVGSLVEQLTAKRQLFEPRVAAR